MCARAPSVIPLITDLVAAASVADNAIDASPPATVLCLMKNYGFPTGKMHHRSARRDTIIPQKLIRPEE